MLKKLKKKFKYLKKIAIKFSFRLIYNSFKILKIHDNRVVLTNYYGINGYSDNLKYIVEELRTRNKSYEFIWIISNMNTEFPSNITTVKLHSLKSFYYLATAKIWIDSQRKRLYITKRRNQYYIQTWHGCLGLKKIEMDAVESYTHKTEYKYERKNDSKMIDLFISGANWFSTIVKRSFLYDKQILETGIPRNDIFFSPSNTYQTFRKQYGFTQNQKIVLYAPTFRNNEKSIQSLDLDYNKFLSCINTSGENYKLIIRLHPRNRKKASAIQYSEDIINGSTYPDMQELLLASDIVITDYSSCIFDFALMRRPAFIYASDIEEYKNDRDFYLDIEKLPFSVSTNTDELIKNMQNFDKTKYLDVLELFFTSVGLRETGHASKDVADIIEMVCNGKSKNEVDAYVNLLNSKVGSSNN